MNRLLDDETLQTLFLQCLQMGAHLVAVCVQATANE